jgi:hypothetical protein
MSRKLKSVSAIFAFVPTCLRTERRCAPPNKEPALMKHKRTLPMVLVPFGLLTGLLFVTLISVAQIARPGPNTIGNLVSPQNCPDLQTATGLPGWQLKSGPGVSSPIVPPVKVNPVPWTNVLPGSSWVSMDSKGGNGDVGEYAYEFTFCLCRAGSHTLNLSFLADNGAKVFLDSTQVFATTGIYNFKFPPQVVSHTWSGGPGTNTLRIVVRNDGNVSGLDAVLKITGATIGACPSKYDIKLTKEKVGSNYRICLINMGDPITGPGKIVVQDALPAGLTVTGGQGSDPNWMMTPSALPPIVGPKQITLTYNIPAGTTIPTGGTIACFTLQAQEPTNCATMTQLSLGGKPVSDANAANNKACAP